MESAHHGGVLRRCRLRVMRMRMVPQFCREHRDHRGEDRHAEDGGGASKGPAVRFLVSGHGTVSSRRMNDVSESGRQDAPPVARAAHLSQLMLPA